MLMLLDPLFARLIDMLTREDILPDVAVILKQLKDGQNKEAYRQLQLLIDKPDLDPTIKAELCDTSLSLAVRLLNYAQEN